MPNVCGQVTQRCATRDKSIKAGDKRQESIKTRSSRTTHCHSIRVYLTVQQHKKNKINLSIHGVPFNCVSSWFIHSCSHDFFSESLSSLNLSSQNKTFLQEHSLYHKFGKKIVLTGKDSSQLQTFFVPQLSLT